MPAIPAPLLSRHNKFVREYSRVQPFWRVLYTLDTYIAYVWPRELCINPPPTNEIPASFKGTLMVNSFASATDKELSHSRSIVGGRRRTTVAFTCIVIGRRWRRLPASSYTVRVFLSQPLLYRWSLSTQLHSRAFFAASFIAALAAPSSAVSL